MRLRAGLTASLVLTSLVAVTACGSPAARRTTAVPVVAPVAAIADPGNCNDGQKPWASLPPAGSTSQSSWAADSTMSAIKKRGTLRVGVSGDALLWGASDPRNGDLAGFDVDVAAEVATALGLRRSQIEYVVLPLSGRLPALKNKSVDLVAERLSMTCDRWQGSAADPTTFINMSSQYYQAGQRVLIRSDAGAKVNSIAALKGQTVCAVAGSTSLANAQKQPGLKLVVAADSGQCLVKFQEGEAAAITADDTTLAGFAKQDPNARVVGEPLSRESYGLGMNADADDFTRFVNAVLQEMRSDGSLRRLYADWMKPNVDPSVKEPAVPDAVTTRNIDGLNRQP